MSKSKDKKEKKIYPKRTHRQLSNSSSQESFVIGKKKITSKNNKDIIKYNISKIYETIICINDNTFEIKKIDLDNIIYENEFFNLIPITSDGNCFFRAISYYLTGNENLHKNLRESVYKYVSQNITKFYEYCYVENNIYYIDIEENNLIIKYILDDYVEKIKKDKFFAGFIEINAMSIILNRPIIILENLENNDITYFKKIASFINNEFEKINLDDIIYINFINKNHYQFLTPNKIFIKNRINKSSIPPISELIIININPINQINNMNFNSRKNNNLIKYNKVNITKQPKEITNKVIENKDSGNKPPKKEENIDIDKSQNYNLECYNNKNKKKINQINLKEYTYTLSSNNNNTNIIYNNDNKILIKIPKYPILVGNKIEPNYYTDIFRYLYIDNNSLDISKYSDKINAIKNTNSRDNKKRDFRKKTKSYYLDENNQLFKKILIKDKEFDIKNKRIISEDNYNYLLEKIPETNDILKYLHNIHKEDGHRGITSLRKYLNNNNIFIEGVNFLTEYTVKNCESCAEKNKTKYKREPAKQIITFYPKQRYIMDLTELPKELKTNNNFIYLLDIIDHFSKYGISIPLENKEANTIFENLKTALECNGFPEELGSDNGKEFKNKILESYLNEKNVTFVHGLPYNPHSQGVVERFHKTVKDSLYSLYCDNIESFDIIKALDIVIKKYNNHVHSTTKFTPNQIFFSNDENLFKKVLENMKASFKRINSDNINFKNNEKCLLKTKFKIKKFFKESGAGVLVYDKIKNKNKYQKLNVTILEKSGTNYKIKIANNYSEFGFKKGDIYIVDYKLLNKCSLKVWKNILKKEADNIANSETFSSSSSENFNEKEKEFILKNKDELI